ncbi:MAG: RDD family protein [Cyclobacteriaceae bacterium]
MKEYAGFWLRFVAYIVDYIIIQIIQSFVVLPVLGVFGLSFGAASGFDFDLDDMSDGEMFAVIAAFVSALSAIILIALIIQVLYYAFMESSNNQATLGKMVLGLIVTDMAGDKLTFSKALLRQLAKILSGMLFMIGFIIAGFTEQKQALHDMIAGALVIKK